MHVAHEGRAYWLSVELEEGVVQYWGKGNPGQVWKLQVASQGLHLDKDSNQNNDQSPQDCRQRTAVILYVQLGTQILILSTEGRREQHTVPATIWKQRFLVDGQHKIWDSIELRCIPPMSKRARDISCLRKNSGFQKRLKISWNTQRDKASFWAAQPPCFQTCHAPTPIRIYSTLQTGPNKNAGGCQLGLRMFLYLHSDTKCWKGMLFVYKLRLKGISWAGPEQTDGRTEKYTLTIDGRCLPSFDLRCRQQTDNLSQK